MRRSTTCRPRSPLTQKNGAAFRSRARAYERSGDVNKAILDYDAALEQVPDDASSYRNRGLLYKTLRD